MTDPAFILSLGRYSFIILSFIIASCVPTVPEKGPVPSPAKKNQTAAPKQKQIIPEGWGDITSRSNQPQIKLWLVNRDFSGTMVLKEMLPDSSAKELLLKEDANFLATISLRAKIAENDPEFRVTRVPSVIDAKRNLSAYVYTERGLFRRVIVFKKQGKFFEVELMQEQSSVEFDVLTEDLVSFATAWYDR